MDVFSSANSLNKVESLQKRALRFRYLVVLLEKAGNLKMYVVRFRCLCTEIYKTVNNINPAFMNEIFKLRKTSKEARKQQKLNLEVPVVNQTTFGVKSIRFYGPKIWNSLPFHIKSSENLETFKNIIKNWNAVSCTCVVCQR